MKRNLPRLRIEGRPGLRSGIHQFLPHGIISIGTPDSREDDLRRMSGFHDRVCRVEFADTLVTRGADRAPDKSDLLRMTGPLKQFFREDPEDTRIFLHCHAGVSRSPAVALFILAYYRRWSGAPVSPNAAGEAGFIFGHMLNRAPHALPHLGIAGHVDDLFPEYGRHLLRMSQKRHSEYQEGALLIGKAPVFQSTRVPIF